MLRFSKKVEYALIALVNMETEMAPDHLVTAKSLSTQFKIPPEVMGKVLQALVRKRLMLSVQGVKGGYTISRALDKISVLEIIEAIDGNIALSPCSADVDYECDQYGYCGLQTPLDIIQTELALFFKRISVLDVKNKSSLFNNAAQI